MLHECLQVQKGQEWQGPAKISFGWANYQFASAGGFYASNNYFVHKGSF